ncbi:nickel/cobalt transporter [Reinekea blandensis]|uniref:Nickel/cobalt efflux system n=1 Tax=Reinekea blandensis MED297 TaxID=314283 RepID=A4BAY0_9GAMM|nr:hypothetical protein [Reinekea blandensis]EAR10593.1 hypothetical protein MED297_11275 [Reinekea sp. MED297] [Reinekea blandensis MED297]
MTRTLYASLSVILILTAALIIWLSWTDIVLFIDRSQTAFHHALSEHIRQFNQTPTVSGLLLTGLAFVYGIFHAIGPGHGKAVLVTYLSTQKETVRQGVFISFSAAVFQSIIAILLVSLMSVLLSQTFKQVNLVSLRAEQSSYVLVIVFGAFLFFRAIKAFNPFNRTHVQAPACSATPPDENPHQTVHHHNHNDHDPSHHDHSHDHNHDHCCHTYVPEKSLTVWQTLTVIMTMGARPCTGAIITLIYAHVVGVYWVGVGATLMMGIGTGVSIALIGIVTIFFRDRLQTLATAHPNGHHHRKTGIIFSAFGGVFLVALGWSLLLTSLQNAIQHPLF